VTSPVTTQRQTVDLQSEEALQLQASFAALDGGDAKKESKDAKQAKLSALKAALKGKTSIRDRYQLEPGNQEQGASAVVVFAFDTLSTERVALKFMVDEAEFDAERDRFVRAASKFVVKVKDVALPVKNSKESSLEHYACLVCERGDFTLEHLTRKRRDMDNLQKQSILHMILKAIHHLHVHAGMVHCDLKPQNVVKVADEDRWKLIDFATACNDGDEVSLDYTLRYAAPEVIKAAAAGAASTVRRCSSDMWSLGVMAYELYTGERLFGDMSNEQVAATLAMPGEVPLPGLHNIEPNAARFILKLLVKDPKERWTAEKSLDARFFRSLDDTTKMSASSSAVAASLRNISTKVDRILDVTEVTLKDMQMGDLLAEIDLWEREPKLQRCVLSKHDHAGQVFNLVDDRTYIVVVNVFRESSTQPNPVSQVRIVLVVPPARVFAFPSLPQFMPSLMTSLTLSWASCRFVACASRRRVRRSRCCCLWARCRRSWPRRYPTAWPSPPCGTRRTAALPPSCRCPSTPPCARRSSRSSWSSRTCRVRRRR
jgi:serine/threonine protein kinase